ncbi:hypothetical protein JVU11DRAFT_6281 [Chiua virens]|nr:hypothetical protein JVU11DRAFT_6281 [Chiua virens]
MSVITSSILHRIPWTPPVAARAEGIYIDLEDGRRVIDGIGGAAVSCIGASHLKVIAAIKDQLDTLTYVYNMQLSSKPAEELAKFLVHSSNGAFELVAFASGGSEAMEAVMKLARQYFVEIGQPARRNFIATKLSFHGNTLSTLSLSYHPTRRPPYEGILDHEHFHHTEEQYVQRLRQELEDKFIELGPETVIGFAAETVVGVVSGVVGAPKGYFAAMKSVCEKYGALFILDEAMSGMGRMGSLHAWQSVGDGAAPDLQAVAKGLGGGYVSYSKLHSNLIEPGIGMHLSEQLCYLLKLREGYVAGSGLLKHGHTYQVTRFSFTTPESISVFFQAHPLACVASLAVQRIIQEEDLLLKVVRNGELMEKLLRQGLLAEGAIMKPFVFDIRGRGAFWGVKFDFSGDEAAKLDFKHSTFATLVQSRYFQNGLIVLGMHGGASLDGSKGDHFMLGPAYTATTEEIEKIVKMFVRSVDEVLRESTVVKASKQKEKEREQPRDNDAVEQSNAPPENTRTLKPTTSKNKRSREATSGKGKAKESTDDTTRAFKRARRATFPSTSTSSLTINEPTKDRKGKKRAAPDPDSEEEESPALSSSKRTRTTAYSLRSRAGPSTSISAPMPKKSRPSSTKGKVAAKAKTAAAASTSRIHDEDVDMVDTEMLKCEEPSQEDRKDSYVDDDDDVDDRDNEPLPVEGDVDNGGDDDERSPTEGPRGFGGLDETAAMAIFGDYRHLGSYMVSLSSRLKTMLNNIKTTASPTTRLVTLQELSELLSISTEDTLAGSFQVEEFVRELVKILGGRGVNEDEDDDGGDDEDHDPDAALAAALAISTGGSYQGDDNLEAQMLACRCLANLMEALPGVAHTVVYHGAIPVLCSKLIEISYIDLAEQTLSTLEKISEEFPSSIVRENGLAALLNYLDFFSIAVQRTALQAAANCCRNISSDHYPMILGVWPIIRNCLSYSDQRLVEYACLCVIRIIDSYHRGSTENLENLLDETAIRAINLLLMPSGGSPLIAANTYTLLLKALATAARASPRIAITLLQADIVDTLYQILTGVLPSASAEILEGSQGLEGDVTHMTVMENLAHRSKDQVEEALSLVSELMPPLPKDGVFDHKGYTDKALARMSNQSRPLRRSILSGVTIPPRNQMRRLTTTDEAMPAVSNAEPPSDRTELLRSKPEVVGRFMQLMVPILIDVYAASVNTPIRVKTLTGLLKAVGFLEGVELNTALHLVPVASFASSILSSKDHPSLIIGALQLVDILLQKLPSEYRPALRREGVSHEIEVLASRALASTKPKEKDVPDLSVVGDVAIYASSVVSGHKKHHIFSLEPEDAITLRARVMRFKYSLGQDNSGGDDSFNDLQRLVKKLSVPDLSEQAMFSTLREFAEHFSSESSVSSFELLRSGAVEGLLRFSTEKGSVSIKRRQEILFETFTRPSKAGNLTQSPLFVLVKKLQESLTRMENFEVVTIAQGSDDSKRSSPSLLARQLRLRLIADDESDIPRNLQNMVVSIHAIATFQALNDYLRPRVAGLMSSGRLSNMLATLTASGFGPGATSRAPGQEAGQATITSTINPSSSSSDVPPPVNEVSRRRSQRLSVKNATSGSSGTVPDNTSPSTTGSASAFDILSRREEPLVQESGLATELTDDEVDAEVFEEDGDGDSAADKTVTLSVGEDDGRIEAQTPDGTRIATPNSSKGGVPPISSIRQGNVQKSSYAAALKAKPTDWHLQFWMDDHLLPLDLTIYGAIHQHEMRKKVGALPSSAMWQGIYTVKFKKVSGPPPSQESRSEAVARIRSPSPSFSSLPDDAPHAKILRLLRVLHKLNAGEAERPTRPLERHALLETAFINNKLTAKLTRQLEEPMIVASSCLPDWAIDLPQNFPFLFPFATRYNYLQSTSFGYARLILKWQSQQNRGQDTSRRDDGIGFLGRLQRQKVRISRKHILESAVKVFELYGSSSSILEVEYFEEVGTGLGPTLEFYSLVSKEFARKDLKIWRDADAGSPGIYVHHPTGLYPAPISPDDIANDGGQKRTHILRVIGQYVAKAMLDSRIIDLSLNKIFIKLVLGEEVPLTIDSLRLVDNDLANSLAKLQSYASIKGQAEKLFRKVALMDIVNVEDLALDFTLPGYDIELKPGGRDIPVTSDNAEQYIHEVLDAILGTGARPQAKAFREGFSKVFPISDLQAFSADELVMLFGNSDEDWGIETLTEAIKADHGFNGESRSIRDLVELMCEFDVTIRRDFLQFITGSPKLPIGGFRGLNPPLTVVRKPHEAPLIADDYLPSVMTCVNYLKLPEYSSKKAMREKLCTAMKEGTGSFHLS